MKTYAEQYAECEAARKIRDDKIDAVVWPLVNAMDAGTEPQTTIGLLTERLKPQFTEFRLSVEMICASVVRLQTFNWKK